MEQREYVRHLLESYRATPGTCGAVRRPDRLLAIQLHERDDYVRAVLRWLKPEGQYLAVNYLIPDKDGPPFGTTRDELWQRFSPHFELLKEWVPRSYPNRKDLELMLWWRRKPAAAVT